MRDEAPSSATSDPMIGLSIDFRQESPSIDWWGSPARAVGAGGDRWQLDSVAPGAEKGVAGWLARARNDIADPATRVRAMTRGSGLSDHAAPGFAFAIWNPAQRTLHAVRDGFGLRPLYYAVIDGQCIVGTSLDAVRARLPAPSPLDEGWIADFLLQSHACDEHATIFREVRRVPPGHVLAWLDGRVRVHAYWRPDLPEPLRDPDPKDCVARFRDLFDAAVARCSGSGPTAIAMSGGLDSTSVAASAVQRAGGPERTQAHTVDWSKRLPDDPEASHAAVAARCLGIRHVVVDGGSYPLLPRGDDLGARTSQPTANPCWRAHVDHLQGMRDAGALTILTGVGGDAVFATTPRYFPDLLRSGRWLRFTREAMRHWRWTGSLGGMGLRGALWPGRRRGDGTPAMPTWLNRGWVRDSRLLERHRYIDGLARIGAVPDSSSHPGTRALRILVHPQWTAQFEDYDEARSGVPVGHPFFDWPLIEFLLSLPLALRNDKRILRECQRGRLPDPVRLRAKQTLQGDLLHAHLLEARAHPLPRESVWGLVESWIDRAAHGEALGRYCRDASFRARHGAIALFAPLALAHWMDAGGSD